MTVRSIHTENAPAAIGPYSQATVAGNFLFTAGQIALDPATGQIAQGDVSVQTERVMRNLTAVLEAAGLTLSEIIKTTCFLSDINDYSVFNSVYVKFVGDPPPARSTFAVAALPRGARVEIEAIAVRSDD